LRHARARRQLRRPLTIKALHVSVLVKMFRGAAHVINFAHHVVMTGADEQFGPATLIALGIALPDWPLSAGVPRRSAGSGSRRNRPQDHRAFRVGLFSIEVEYILHAGDELAIDLRNAPHVFAMPKAAAGRAPDGAPS
jgi:hypothetical protein